MGIRFFSPKTIHANSLAKEIPRLWQLYPFFADKFTTSIPFRVFSVFCG